MKHRYDPILEELHKVKEAIAKAHDYDINKLVECVRAREGKTPAERCPHMPKRTRRPRKAS